MMRVLADFPRLLAAARIRFSNRARRRTVVVCLVIALLSGCAEASSVGSGVYVADAGASANEPKLIGGPAGAPVWAPDASAIAWANEDGLFVGDPETSQVANLSPHPIAGRPAWSPDGRSLAYVDRNSAALVVADAKSGATTFSSPVMTSDAQHEPLALLAFGGPAWAPDGSRLAFNCWDGAGDEVCVIRADGTDRRQISRVKSKQKPDEPPSGALVPAPANVGPPAWAPDGKSLAVASYPERRGAARGVFIVDLENGTARRVSTLLPNSEISWVPDGDAVLFSATEEGRSDVRRVSIRDDGVANLTATLPQSAREPALSPDGSRLAIASGGAIVVVSLEGDVGANLTSPLRDWAPAWSPGGDRLAFAAVADPIASFT